MIVVGNDSGTSVEIFLTHKWQPKRDYSCWLHTNESSRDFVCETELPAVFESDGHKLIDPCFLSISPDYFRPIFIGMPEGSTLDVHFVRVNLLN